MSRVHGFKAAIRGNFVDSGNFANVLCRSFILQFTLQDAYPLKSNLSRQSDGIFMTGIMAGITAVFSRISGGRMTSIMRPIIGCLEEAEALFIYTAAEMQPSSAQNRALLSRFPDPPF